MGPFDAYGAASRRGFCLFRRDAVKAGRQRRIERRLHEYADAGTSIGIHVDRLVAERAATGVAQDEPAFRDSVRCRSDKEQVSRHLSALRIARWRETAASS